jgi:hypothetical protein
MAKAKDYSYKDAMDAALEAGMMGIPGSAAGAAAGALKRGIGGMRDRFPEEEQMQPPGMMDRIMDMEGMKAARDAAKSYGRAYKEGLGMKKGGMASSKMGKVKTGKPNMSSASSRADGIAQRGKTRGRMV